MSQERKMIKITIPSNNIAERKYILDVVFDEFLGLEYKITEDKNCKEWKIILANDKILIIKDTFFNNYPNDLEYLKIENIPDTIEELDIFAASFFMLVRWEEYVNKNRDLHKRFLACESLAYKQGFLNRPIVNEYLEELKRMLLKLEDTLEFKVHKSKQFVSCDIDQPFDCTVENITNLLKTCAGDMIKRKSITEALKRVRRYVFNKLGNYKYDKNYTFEWYMDVCEQAGLKAAFYFIPDSRERGNGCYNLKDKKVQKLLSYIDGRGHEIGVHGSYQTYQDKEKAKLQKEMLEDILKKLEIKQKVIGNRQHYLRWDSAITPSILEYAGFLYDTTSSYADMPGFRHGVCYEFSMFDFLQRQKLKLRQRPLIVMECSVIDDCYMGLGYSYKALKVMQDLKEKCYRYHGNFSLLWHNSHLKKKEDKKFFMELIK